jgi:hypothetical protein
VGGGSGYRGCNNVSLDLLDAVEDSSEGSLLSSALSGVGGSRREVSGNSVPGLFACISVNGGGAEIASVD